MRALLSFLVATAAGLGLASEASAQWSLAARGGSTGFGADVGFSFNPQVGLRGAWYGGSISRDLDESGVHYDGTWNFGTGLAVVDFHPGSGAFRLSLGLGYNNNKLNLTGRGSSGTVNVNGQTYNISEIGTLTGRLSFNRTNPYFGVGWGSSSKASHGQGLFFSADIGALFVKPRVSLTANCGSAFTPTQCAQLQADLRAEEADVRDNTGLRNMYPVLSFGIGYRF